MKTRVIICSLTISAAIWLGTNWFLREMEVNDYGFSASLMIVCVWYVAKGIIKIINKEKEDEKDRS